ncbi:Os03g0802650, partial [Oryza sativa Japonica Group]
LSFSCILLGLGLLQRVHQPREAGAGVVPGVLGREVLADVGRHQVHLRQQPLDGGEHLVVVDVEVDLGHGLERLEVAVGHLDLLVHPPRPDQRRVQVLDVVRRQHDQPLLPERRPQPVDEV